MDTARSFQEAYAPMAVLADQVKSRRPSDHSRAEEEAMELKKVKVKVEDRKEDPSVPVTPKGPPLTDEQARRKLARMEAKLLKKAR